MRRLLFLGLLVVGSMSIVGILFFTAPNHAAAAPRATSQAAVSSGFGQPAIPVKTANIATSSTASPAFSGDDVRQYVLTHPVFRATVQGKPNITTIQFMTSKAASTLLHDEPIGLVDTAVVCYVEFHNTVTFPGPHGTGLIKTTAYEIFDGSTGNLIIIGGHN